MTLQFTEAQALALITDHNSQQRGKKLAADLGQWASLGADAVSVWGECQGSGSEAYQVAAGLLEAASKCSCPRPDAPCKHAAGLLLLYARQPELFIAPAPDKLAAWRKARQQHADRDARQSQPRDPAEAAAEQAAAAARLAKGVDTKRQQRMVAGAHELAAVLEDVVRQGLARLPLAKAEFWEAPAKRLIDNQLPGLVPALRRLPDLAAQPEQLLAGLGELYLVLRACQNLPHLPADLRYEVLQQAGATLRRDDLLAAAALVEDQWQVLGWVAEREGEQYQVLSSNRRTWLYGATTGRYAMLYDYAHGYGDLPPALPLAGYQAGGLAYYPGRYQLRATPAQLTPGAVVPPAAAPMGQSIGQLLAGYAAAVGCTPWLRQYPVTLTGVLPALTALNRRTLHHPAENLTVPLLSTRRDLLKPDDEFDQQWYQLLGNSAGQPCTVFGEWDGQQLRLLRSWPGSHPTPTDLPARGATSPTGDGRAAPWPTLVQAATVGLDALPLPELPGLPPAATPAQRLLLTAGTTALLQKLSFESVGPIRPVVPARLPAETRPLVPPAVAALLHEALMAWPSHQLLPEYLRGLDARALRLPPWLLVLLQRYQTSPPPGLVGELGAWVYGQHPHWGNYLNASPTGPPPPYEDPRLKQVRRPDQQAKAWELAAPLLTVKRPARKPPRLEIAFPKAWGLDWRAVGVKQPTHGTREQGGKLGAMLWQVLAMLPLRRWAEHFGLSISEVLDLTTTHNRGHLLRAAWAEAAQAFPDREVVEQLVLRGTGAGAQPDELSWCQLLLGLLPPAEREALLAAPPETRPAYLLPVVLATLPHPWPAGPAAALLPYLRHELLPSLPSLPAGVSTVQWQALSSLTPLLGKYPVLPDELLPVYAEALPELIAEFPIAGELLAGMLAGVQNQQRLVASLAELTA